MSDKLLHHFLKEGTSGLIHKPDVRDHVLDQEVLGAGTLEIKPLGRLEKLLASDLSKPENILYQGGTLSCVSNASAFLNMWISLVIDDNPHCESWAYLYKNVPHFQGGTSMNDNLNILKKKGCCLESTLPSRPLADTGEAQAQDKSVLTPAMDEEAKHFQIEGYLSLSDLRREALYRVLVETPISIAINVGNTYSSKAGIVPPDPNSATFGHNAALLDVVGESNIGLLNNLGFYLDTKHLGWYILINWWNPTSLDFRIISPNYHIIAAKVLKDRRDTKLFRKETNQLNSNDMKLIKTSDSPKIYLLDYSNRRHWFCNEDTYERFVSAEKDFSKVEFISDEVMKSYSIGENLNAYGMSLLEIIKFWAQNGKLGKNKNV